ncbi:MAG TPA: hypothetical protein VFR73_12995, partial [Hyphomicrobiaceae bacterium]|nr:hypothetical protein [Hyphomicrobiaceae bacterium]
MVKRKSEAHLSDTWRYEPDGSGRPRGRVWQVAEVSALLAGVVALVIALTAPLAWMLRSDGEVVADREGGMEPPGETRIMRTEPVHTGSARDPLRDPGD